MTIHYEEHRQGMTIFPEMTDEVTGQKIEGSAQVVDSRWANWANKEEADFEEDLEAVDREDLDHPEHINFDVALADAVEEINTSPVAPNPEFVAQVQAIETDGSSEAMLVQELIARTYNGQMTGDEAVIYAIESGYDAETMLGVFREFQELFPQER